MNSSVEPPTGPVVVRAESGPFIDLGDHRGNAMMTAESVGGAFMFADLNANPGANVTRHMHHHEDEMFFILHGRFALEVGDRFIEAGQEDAVFMPRLVLHRWSCISREGGAPLS